jgi:dipeptidyl aminopeptidase/acylaminoacyl peptidase
MKFQADIDGVTFTSHGHQLLGGFYRAAGDSPRPTALLCHGLPGVEKNLDIAYALRGAGWNCLYFHYRGSWGSEGSYSLNGLIDDARAATDWLVQQPSVDVNRLAIVGSSIGGYVALNLGAHDRRFKMIVAICPFIDGSDVPLSPDYSIEWANMLNGISAEQLKFEWDHIDLLPNTKAQLIDRKILLITGGRDALFPISHHRPLIEGLPNIVWTQLVDGDHTFNTCRIQLVDAVVDWLLKQND